MKKSLLILALTGAIAACGGSDNNSTKQSPKETPPPATTQTGILTDGVVSGVSYETNSGLKGVTNDKGEFEYKEGDKVKFTIGNVQLGDEIVAQARVTPLDLAEDQDSRTNLLVFLQSFDSDSNHDNGITISTKATEILKDQNIDFKQSPNNFINDVTFRKTLIQAELTEPVTPEQAKQNFQKAFYKDIAGVWQFSASPNSQNPVVLLYIKEDGTYLLGEYRTADNAGKPGIEMGNINWNATSQKLAPSISIDTNGEWGLSHPEGHHTLGFDGAQLIMGEPDIKQIYTFSKVTNKENSIIGSWKYTEGQVFTFLENGTYFMLDPVGDTMVEEGEQPCGGAGIELGKYTINNTNLLIHSVTIDTNHCAGFSDNRENQTLPFSVQDDKFSFSPEDEGTFTLDRIK